MAKKQTLKGFSPIRAFKNDDVAVSNGVWRDIEDGAAKLLIARWGNPAHQEYLRVQREQNIDVLDKDNDESKALWDEISNRSISMHILKGWEGILDENGKAIEFTSEVAYDLLSQLPEFSNLVFSLSTESEQYRFFREREAVKN